MTNATPTARPALLPRMPWWVRVVLLLVAGWFVGTQFLHVFREAINWDEFALLERADRTLRLGQVIGGGRPGLVPLVLTVFVRDCVDSVQAVVNARLAWMCLTLAYLVGVYALVRRWFTHCGRVGDGRAAAPLAVVLLAFLPAFVTWSVQVRTDQAALATAIWGSVMLLSTSLPGAAVAGVLWGIAVLCTQKAIYVIALGTILFITASATRILPRHELSRVETVLVVRRMLLVTLAAAATVGLYLWLVPEAASLASTRGVTSAIATMEWTRKAQGYRIYVVHATRLVVHWAALVVLAAWSARVARKRDSGALPVLGAAWGTLLLGLAVVRFHGSSFPYFIMTAGLFPAIALALPADRILARAGRSGWPLLAALVAMAAMQSARESVEMLADTQSEQRATLRMVLASGLRTRRGYQVEGALLCSRDPDPLPTLFSQDIWRRFVDSPVAAQNAADFIAHLRSAPVAYVVESYRLRQFPETIRQFFAAHYVWHARSLFVAGYRLTGLSDTVEVDVIVPGRYRWDAASDVAPTSILVDASPVAPSSEVELSVGIHRISTTGAPAFGSLILGDVPRSDEAGFAGFYLTRQIVQLGGWR